MRSPTPIYLVNTNTYVLFGLSYKLSDIAVATVFSKKLMLLGRL